MGQTVKYLLGGLLLLMLSCVKDIPNPPKGEVPQKNARGLYILNEGAFGNNNAELSFYEIQNAKAYQDLYKTKNGKNLGDVAQSILWHADEMWISINNSGRVVILDTGTLIEKKQINLPYPRQMLEVHPGKIYIGSLYSQQIQVIDPRTYEHPFSISLPFKNPEQMIQHQGQIWVSMWDTACSVLAVIDTANNQVIRQVPIQGRAPHGMVIDQEGHLWVLSGNKYKNKISYLQCIDPNTDQILSSFEFLVEQDPFRLQINHQGDTLYFIQVNYTGAQSHNGLYRMGIKENTLPKTAWIPAQNASYFWAYTISPDNHHLYISDPRGFNQRSLILHYDQNGIFQSSFEAGIGANSFYFR
jgi:hypothetical protein